jgi:hypothetical protein
MCVRNRVRSIHTKNKISNKKRIIIKLVVDVFFSGLIRIYIINIIYKCINVFDIFFFSSLNIQLNIIERIIIKHI